MVNYRSTALAETAPELVSSVDSKDVARIPAILAANQAAERVREEFKNKKRAKRTSASNSNGSAPLDEEADKAGRYDRRLKMNRESAAASRVRREAYIKALEQQLLLEHEKFRTLRAEFDAERAAHSKLRTDVENARLLAAAPVPNVPQPVAAAASSTAPQLVPDVKDEDLVELPYLPTPDSDALADLLFSNAAGGTQPPPPMAEMYAANVTDVFADLALPLTQVPPNLVSDIDPQNIDRIMDFENE